MKWLLQSPAGKNPGDDFIRLGVTNLVREVDPDAEITIIDKMERGQWVEPTRFDKAVWCGGPVFWSSERNGCWDMDWWEWLVNGWISARKKDFIVLGAGLFARYRDTKDSIKDLPRLKAEAQRLIDRSYAVYSRDNFSHDIVDERIIPLPCPSIFAIPYCDRMKTNVVINLMRNGAHYDYFDPISAKVWRDIVVKVSKSVHPNSIFAAHDDDEAAFARELGWTDNFIVEYNGNPEALINLYSTCYSYFGNRIHGAIATAGAGGEACCCGYDSRLDAVKIAGGITELPQDLNDINVALRRQQARLFDRTGTRKKYIEILTEFKNV